MLANASLQGTLLLAGLTTVFVLLRQWKKGRGAGLLLTYLLSFATIHLLAPLIYLIPWYGDQRIEPTRLGLRESTIALLAFAVGAEIGAALAERRRAGSGRRIGSPARVDARTSTTYLAAGIFVYAVLIPASRGIPTLAALVSMALPIVVAAMAMKCWAAWHEGRQWAMWQWAAASALFPVLTVLTQGFLGFGFGAMLTLVAFIASYYRPRWRILVAGVVLAYLGMSVYVTYMRDRTSIRAIVWFGGTLRDSAEQTAGTFADFEWFDPNNVKHLDRVDGRLNQDFLLGLAVESLDTGRVGFANGSTIGDALLGLVPRALWPDKPIAAGSGDLVATYTGLRFPEGTSVGIGQVMECYVNFGTLGVVVGFLLIGGLVVFIDRVALQRLVAGDLSGFMLWYLPGLAFIQVGGSFVELAGVAASSIVVGLLFRHLGPKRDRRLELEARGGEGRPATAAARAAFPH